MLGGIDSQIGNSFAGGRGKPFDDRRGRQTFFLEKIRLDKDDEVLIGGETIFRYDSVIRVQKRVGADALYFALCARLAIEVVRFFDDMIDVGDKR